MTTPGSAEVIYEVECELDPSIVEAFDAWLPGHVREVVACAGFLGAEIRTPVSGAAGPVTRRTRYRLESMAALESYIEKDAPRLRADGASRFGEQVKFSRRVLPPEAVPLALPEEPVTCRNCGAAVPGRYCAECGQSRGIHVPSMHEVAGDVTHSLLHLDSRAWNTLRTLVLKPGHLTNEFIAGRHQRYLPPFRLYLVISVAFFALSAMLPDAQMLHVNAEGETVIAFGVSPPPVGEPAGVAGRTTATLEETKRELRRSLEEVTSAPNAPEAPRRGAELAEHATDDLDGQAGCNIDSSLPKWLNALLTEACRKVQADGGRRLGEVFLRSAPRFMFLFLPMMAGVALLFYWKPRRLYAEHLVAFLHAHAFVFLILALTSIINAIMRLDLPLVSLLLGVLNAMLLASVPYYVFRAMRVVYGESRVRTLAKFAALSLVYFTLLAVTVVVGVFYSMLSL